MDIYRITVYRIVDNRTEVIMTAEFPAAEIYHANAIYNILFNQYDNIIMERVTEVATIFGSKVNGKGIKS